MSLKREVNDMFAEKLPAKGDHLKNGIVASGLRKRSQMEQLVDYLNFGQEKCKSLIEMQSKSATTPL